jgi:hypothetical protein
MNIPTIWHYIYGTTNKVILPPPLENEKVNISFKPEKENSNLSKLLHDVDIYADQVPIESEEELLRQLKTYEKGRSEHSSGEYHLTKAPPKKAYNQLLQRCEEYYQLTKY